MAAQKQPGAGPGPGSVKKDSRAWEALTPPLADWTLEAVSSMGFQRMTPVQAHTMPNFMGNKDVVVEAVTGSGKTLAFLLPIIQRLLRLDEPTKPRHVFGIIISPTRELATQIHSVLLSLLAFHPASAELLPLLAIEDEKRPATTVPVVVPQLLVGGTSTTAKDLSFFTRHTPNVLIATPGRLVELLSSPYVLCSQDTFEMLVLDEADRLLDLGFYKDLQKILSYLPKQRRTGLFSASISEAVSEIIRVGLRNPVKITVRVKALKDGGIIEDRKTPASLQMSYLITPASHKLPALRQLLESLNPRPQKTIVFLSTCYAVDYFQHILPSLLPQGFAFVPLHGKHEPKVRDRNFSRFLTSVSPTVLLTTDLASRGLDIPQVDLVVQIDPPSDLKVFIHRCGRAGRAGRRGLAVLMLHPGRQEEYVNLLDVRQTPVSLLQSPSVTVPEEEAILTTEKIRSRVRKDRRLHDLAHRGFASWVRSYKAHQGSSIFRLDDLDWTDLGSAWGLLCLPRMPELKRWDGDKRLGQVIDWDTYSYKDKTLEQRRLEALEAKRASGEAGSAAVAAANKKKRLRNAPWSEKHEKEEVRDQRREKRRKKKDAIKQSTMTEAERAEDARINAMVEEIIRQRKGTKAAEAEFEGFSD